MLWLVLCELVNSVFDSWFTYDYNVLKFGKVHLGISMRAPACKRQPAHLISYLVFLGDKAAIMKSSWGELLFAQK